MVRSGERIGLGARSTGVISQNGCVFDLRRGLLNGGVARTSGAQRMSMCRAKVMNAPRNVYVSAPYVNKSTRMYVQNE